MAPRCLALHRSGELQNRIRDALDLLRSCRLCPRSCGANRLDDEPGFCCTGRRAVVASFHLHFGEEAPLVGERGSGTIFFSGCNLGCRFCQNFDISRPGPGGALAGIPASPEELAGVMLDLQRQGAANINFVTPTHVAPQILEALPLALDHGLALPLVWNCGGYEGLDMLRLLDGVADIYMPDVKIWDPGVAARLLGAPDYPERARAAVAEMHRQVGDLSLDGGGLAAAGLLVRHLVLPGGLAGTGEWARFLAALSPSPYVNVMDQYRPCGEAESLEEIARPLAAKEFAEALDAAKQAGLTRLDKGHEGLALRLLRALR